MKFQKISQTCQYGNKKGYRTHFLTFSFFGLAAVVCPPSAGMRSLKKFSGLEKKSQTVPVSCHFFLFTMDRGRVGYNKVGNKSLRENHIKHVRHVHLERLRKIRTRIPGSSSTLDNQLPRNAGKDSQSLNPRKASLKRENNRVVLRQNK